MANKSDYLGLSRIVSLILAIIPFTSWILGVVTRFQEGKILAGVMRTARSGVVSNFKQGGHVALHELTEAERSLAQTVIDRFEAAGAPLHMAGVDLLYDHGQPVIGEVEDVVGSRMLYNTSDIDIVALYLEHISAMLSKSEA